MKILMYQRFNTIYNLSILIIIILITTIVASHFQNKTTIFGYQGENNSLSFKLKLKNYFIV